MNQKNQKDMNKYFFWATAENFKKVPGSPIAYWVSKKVSDIFQNGERLDSISPVKVGLQTGSNEKFVREWFEVSVAKTSFCSSSEHDFHKKWFPYNKGGEYRKWYGNNENVVNWEKDGSEIQSFTDENGKLRSRPQNRDFYFKESISWSFVSSSYFGARFSDTRAIFDVGGSSAFPDEKDKYFLTGLLCSSLSHVFMTAMNPTLNFQVGNVASIPIVTNQRENFNTLCCKQLIDAHKVDWNSYETAWDFTSLPLLYPDHRQSTLMASFQRLRAYWQAISQEMQQLEVENNRIFIEAYGLKDELTADVPLKEITLTCNPHYRYGGDKTEVELEAQLQADTMAEFLSYAVGCMFGRYSLDKPGLVLANQGDTLADYLHQIPEPSFMPDEDNVIPLLDGDWFADDVTERFRTFLRVTFGEQHYEENLAFIEQSLGKDVRKYFIKDFYADHVKRYKKRPIYWLFASPKGTFSALIYLHRYRPDTVSVVLQYLRDFQKKLASRLDYLQQVGISTSSSQAEKTRALKEIETLKKQLVELDNYERDVLYPLASDTKRLSLDLDDGVKVNYLRLSPALKKIAGLDAKSEG
ncbi:BREX-1 system adenine-specific DNA-methyltransferase PglX [Halopseudomonas sp.]|uniref:BREX-1 system adenine-specific DNA-methyltransferase PglX n=1 Tax=Halopseudomonas sp. TaxID=2901191 RepID=UPI0039E27560